MPSEPYTKHFYDQIRQGSTQSAEVIVPILMQLLTVRSVVDVGCGDGSWLAVFHKLGVDDVLGIDGEYVDDALLQIPQDRFRPFDLAKPPRLERTFDLAISMEVAEHLPPESAPAFVESLTRLAPAVLFSAAIPHQGGVKHTNEQWQDSWAKLFQQHGYVPVDCIRPQVWQNDAVEFWYAQNTLLFACRDLLERHPALKAEFGRTGPNHLRLVHPRQYLHLHELYRDAAARADNPPPPSGVKEASRIFATCLKNSIRWRLFGRR